ncbi:MAG: ribonuclease HII [Clostridia bacterium]|nr:ribonuclease HII [Clostridia bacterium]
MARESKEEKLIRLTTLDREALMSHPGKFIAGIDEVGRGPLAGPVVTACVSIPFSKLIPGVDDSKKLSEAKREAIYPLLIENAHYAKTAWVTPQVIDEINILNATKRAMEECAAAFENGVFLVDAVKGLHLPGEAVPIIHGDAMSYMIAATSIVAKVERDRYMALLHEKYPMYNFIKNKGYGTKEHIEAIRKYGPCPEHRMTFIQKFLPGDNA